MDSETGQHSLVVIATLNEGEAGEKVTLRCIPLASTEKGHSVNVDQPAVQAHLTYGEYSETNGG